MNSEATEQTRPAAWLIVAAAGVRAAFGVVMAIDAYLKWQPAFATHYVGYLQNAANTQSAWLAPWFNFWLRVVTPNADFFVSATRLIETAIAIGLLLGFCAPVHLSGWRAFQSPYLVNGRRFRRPVHGGRHEPRVRARLGAGLHRVNFNPRGHK